MKNGEFLYKQLKLGEINKSQLTEQQKGDLYKYMVDSKKVTVDMIKPEVAQKYNLSTTPTYIPSRSKDTNVPVYNQTIPSRSPDTNAPINTPTYTPTFGNNFKPINKSTNPEMELVDLLSNLTLDRGRTHERQQGGAYTPKPIIQSTPTDLTLADRIQYGLKGIGQNWVGGNASAVGTITEYASEGLKKRLEEPEQNFYSQDIKDKSIPIKQYSDIEKQYITDALNANKTKEADEYLTKASENMAKGREGLGTTGGVVYDILTGAGQMGADIGTAAVTGVGMLPILGMRVFGQSASEARQSGATIDQQMAYGAISAGIEIATEKLVGGLPFANKLGMGGVADDALHNGAIKLAKMIKGSPRLAKAFVYLVNMGGEGVEEMIAEFLSPFAKRLTYDPNADLAELEEIAYSGLLGAGISGVMGGGVIGNPEVDFNISEIYNPTPKHEFDINNYQYNPNNSVYPQQPKQTIKVEQNINGIQDTLSQGLNQIYNALDNGQKDEQSINTMITNLERVKKLIPTLSNYVDSQIEKLNNYKVIEQPQTNEINEVEQSIEQDTNVAQIGDNDATENIQTLIKQGSYKYNGLPVRYNSELKGEARNKTTYIEVGDKFFNLDSNQQINVLNHEVAHNNDLFDGKKFIEVMDGGIFGKPVTRRDGSVTWEGIFGDIGSNAVEETYTEALKVFRDDPEWLKEKHPKVYEYFTGERIVDDNKIDNIIPIEELRQKEIEQPTAEDYLKDMEQDMQIQEEYPIGTKIQARNGNTFEVISKEGDLFTVKNTQTNQEQSYTEGGLKKLGNILQESNNIITETKQIDSVTNVTENVGYHAGDLGKADYLNIMPGRGTGHFGTGTYFVGNELNITDDYTKRPRHTVSFEGYNLYKPKTAEEGRNLHSFLKKINDISFKDGYEDIIDDILKGKVDAEYIENIIATKFPYNSDFDTINDIDYSNITETDNIDKLLSQIDNELSKVNIPPEVTERKNNIERYQKSLDKLIDNIEEVKNELKNKFNFSDEKINKTIKELYQYGTSNLKSNKMDSPSTVFMKNLGYEGVDVRGLKGLDDTEFGSVIYDLKDTSQATEQPTTNETIPAEQIVEEDTKDVKIGSKESKITSKKYKSSKSKDSTPYQIVLENDEIKIYYFDGRKKYGYFPLNYKEYLKQETTYDRRKFIDREMTNYLLERDGKAFNYKLNEKGMEILKLYGFETDAEPVQKALEEVLKEAGVYQQTLAETMEERRTKREQEQSKQKEIKTDVAENETTETENTAYFTKMESSDGEILTQEYDTKEKAEAAAENIKKLGYDVTVEEGIKQTEFTIDNFMDSVNENDIDFKRAENAYRAVSFDPDKRAKSIQSNYVDTMKEVYNELLPLAETDEQKVILLEEMQKFKENYLKKQNAVLDATSRTMSSMITGPAKFPTARNQKALETEHKRMTEFSEWLNKAVPTIKKKLDNSLPDKGNEMLNKLKKEIDDTIASLIAVKNGSPYNPAAFRNSLKGYFERNLNNGYLEEVIQAAEYLKEQQKEKGITVFMSANNIWKQIESAKAKETDKVAFKEYDGAEIVENKDIDRIQIFFDETPSEEIRNEMKKTGWHYSKANNNAWQRKITNNAKQDAEKIIGKYFKAKEETEINKVTKPQLYRYYLTQRPPAPGAIPSGSKNTVSFDTKQEVDGLEAWGYVEYDKPLTEQQINDYELTDNTTKATKQSKKVTIRRRLQSNELDTIELAQRVKAEGKDAQSSYGLFVKERNLKPEIDAKEFNEIFKRVSPNEYIITETVDFAPTHKYLGKDVMITDIGNKFEYLSENGSTGTEFKPLRKEFVPLTTISETETVKTNTEVLGKTGIAKDNEGNAIEFVYEVVNVNDLITSHDTNLNVNNNYPSELQPRERTRTASQMQVNDIVNNLQPEFLGENPKISDGSPIVGNDNIVESGNGRTIALAKMYQSKHKNAQKYTNWLITNAETFGIDTNNLPENPVLIRRRTTEVNRAEFVKKANESSIATMSATETARSDADKLTNEVLSLFVANENGIINTTDNKGFIGKFISEVIPKNEQNKYLTDKGELSQEGLARVRNAIFYKAYGDINLMNKLAESLDNNTKNITNTMLAIAPKIVDVKTNIIKGNLYDIDYSSDIAQAANEYIALKETGKDVELYLQQESLFDNEDTALVKDIIAIFNANNRSAKKMAMVFNKLFDSIESLGNPNQMNMFGKMETPDKVHVLEATLRRLESEDNAQVTLFQSERKESTGDTQSNKGQTRAYKGGESYTRVNNSDLIDMSRKLKKPTEIRKDITKKFGVPNSTKKFNRSKKFLGYYKIMPEVIRLRYDNDIGTVMHELGHHLDKKYSFNNLNKQLITDMINKMNPAFKDNYQKSELPGEAIAEFLRYYTTDPATAEQFAGDFYELFEQTLSKDDLKNIQEIRSDVLRWVNAERAEKRQSTIVPLGQKKKVSERISETIKFEKNNALLFDRYAPIQEFVKTVEKLTGRKLPASLNPYMLVERTYKNNSTIEGIIKGQLRDTEFKPLDTDDSLQKIVDDVKRDVTPFEDYLKLKHAITLAEKDHMIYNPDIYNNVEDMQQDLEFMEQQYPQFIELSERLYDWYDKFFKAWVIDTNMLGEDSKKVYKKMRQEYPYYVPMFRVREDGSSKQASSSLTDQKSPVDRLSEKGNDRDTISPIDNIVTQVSRMVNAYSKNNVMRAIVENYNTVDGLGGFIDRVPPDMEKQILSTQKIKDSLEAEFEDVDNIDDIINSIPDLIENYKPLTKSKDKEIVGVITKSGKRQFYQVFDKAFLNSLTNMNPTQLDTTVRMIASIRRTTTALTTGLNPIFGIVSNAPRDFMQAYVFGSYKNPAEYVYEYVKALTGVIRGNENYKTFRDIGGVYGSSMTSELRNNNDFIRRLTKYRKGQKVGAKNALSYVGELILDLNDAIETAPRLAEFNKAYKIAKNRGDSDYDATLYALSRADDVTLNFSRRGEIMNTAVGQSIPYLNAGLQGMDKLRRGLFTGEERTQTLIKSITMLTIPTILLWLAHRDDEDYEKLTKGIKDNYWILWKNPDGSFVRIPKPKDLSTIFSADFERALNAYFKEEGAGAFEGFYSTIADSLLPPVDTVFRPLIDVIGNEKWSGGKIIPMAMDYLPKTEQYDETTSKIAVRLAQLVGKVVPDSNFASPKNVDYILDQYYGGLADILLPITTPTTYVDVDTLRDKYNYLAMPMAAIMQVGETINRKFKADPSYSNDVVNDFYDLRDKTIKANNAYEKRGVMSNDVDLIAETNFKAYYKSISSMWKTIDTIDSLANKTLPDEYKEGFKKLINQSRFADSEKKKVLNDLKDGKLNRESVTMLQKTVRDEIVKLADKAVKEYKANHKKNNEVLK